MLIILMIMAKIKERSRKRIIFCARIETKVILFKYDRNLKIIIRFYK